MMTSQVVFRIDKNLKDKATKKAQAEGIPFTAVLTLATQAYVKGDLSIQLISHPKLNAKTRRELLKASKDIRQGKNLSPAFDNAKEAIAYLKTSR
jgi:antitoxin component of RelBE/YafQ-DinJ toxin-antitoxin module